MRTNKTRTRTVHRTAERAKGNVGNLEDQLRRSVMNCFLWEKQFYENGESIADRIKELVGALGKAQPEKVYQIAVEARMEHHLRHVPLFIAACMSAHQLDSQWVRNTVRDVIQRPDEIAELLSIFWEVSNNGCKCPRAIRNGVQDVVNSGRFKEFHYAKYKGKRNDVTLRDAMRICRPKPAHPATSDLLGKVVRDELEVPDTWETRLSGGEDKEDVFTDLLKRRKLGGLALLRNLRKMHEVNVSKALIREAVAEHTFDRVLPFRFISAAKYAPWLEPELEMAMLAACQGMGKIPGKTGILIDVSGSMGWSNVSSKSELTRSDAAYALSILLREICEHPQVFSFSNRVVQVPARRGFALRDAIDESQPHGGTHLGAAVAEMEGNDLDRLIVFTDEQSHDAVYYPDGIEKAYTVNVASNRVGVSYDGQWRRIDGFSESIVKWIAAYEAMDTGDKS